MSLHVNFIMCWNVYLDSWSESVFGMCFRFTQWVDKLIDQDSMSDQPIRGAEPLLSI